MIWSCAWVGMLKAMALAERRTARIRSASCRFILLDDRDGREDRGFCEIYGFVVFFDSEAE